VLPKLVIYDPWLTLRMPVALSVTSGLNALAHCVEALYAGDANPITSLMAQEGIVAMAQALPRIVGEPHNAAARADALYGAWLAGASLGAVGMALHHKLCHTLGGTFNLPHASTHAVILPHAVAYNSEAAPEAMERVAAALDVEDAALGLWELAQSLGAPLTLHELGLEENDLDQAADEAVKEPYWNPRPVERYAIRDLLEDAFHGRKPGQRRR
jgi:maleylacetate reductase